MDNKAAQKILRSIRAVAVVGLAIGASAQRTLAGKQKKQSKAGKREETHDRVLAW